MKNGAVVSILAALISSVMSSPAIVWTRNSINQQTHSSELTDITSLVSDAFSTRSESSLGSVIFVVGRDADGSDGLTSLTTSGSLPNVASKYSSATSIHHSVRGIEDTKSVLRDTSAAIADNGTVHQTSLKEFMRNPVTASTTDALIVNVPYTAKAKDIDAAVTSAIDNSNIHNVIFTAARSADEVRLERNLKMKQSFFESKPKQNSSRRRLEDQNDNDYEAVYYVNMTPNIFSGIMFFFFFIAVTTIGIGCMDDISGQDVFCTKYPTIGREA